ncbi:hypothetical protein VNI00_012090 [Paramarasmius palmivorus]|uniref:HMG box domain-containing protein n=1 Tax=Paramarasmius palmivorus TaxID=297713 RepID=A0AAW0C8F8_9AGAR
MPMKRASSSVFVPSPTPNTFDGDSDIPGKESNLFSSNDVPRYNARSEKEPGVYIPRRPNAFTLFRSSFLKSQHLSTEVETDRSTLSKMIGLTWRNLSDDERKVWEAKAKDALVEYKRKYPH